MAGLNKFDPRVDDLVMETRTIWTDEVADISDEDRHWVSQQLHANPQLASSILYERSHTGFTRIITVSLADIQQLYASRADSGE